MPTSFLAVRCRILIAWIVCLAVPAIGRAGEAVVAPPPGHGAAVAGVAYDVYLLIGQSNMDGRSSVKDLPPELAKPSDRHIIFYQNPDGSSQVWKPLAPGFGRAYGPELSFAAALEASSPGVRIALIKASKGNTSLKREWNPAKEFLGVQDRSGRCYRAMIDAINRSVAQLPAGKHRLRGVVWHQGESDGGDSPAKYEGKLTQLITRLREDLRAPALPFIIGELRPSLRKNITPAQQAVVAKVPGCAFVPSDGLTGDSLHFDGKAQVILGQRYAEAVAKLPAGEPTILEPGVVPTAVTVALPSGKPAPEAGAEAQPAGK